MLRLRLSAHYENRVVIHRLTDIFSQRFFIVVRGWPSIKLYGAPCISYRDWQRCVTHSRFMVRCENDNLPKRKISAVIIVQ